MIAVCARRVLQTAGLYHRVNTGRHQNKKMLSSICLFLIGNGFLLGIPSES